MLPPVPAPARLELSLASAPPTFLFPERFRALLGIEELPNIDPLFFLVQLEPDGIEDWTEILRHQFPGRVLVPFAKDGGTDDVYCFDGRDTSGNPTVLLIHSFTEPGWEYRGEWFHFDSWFTGALEHHEAWLKGELPDFETGTRTTHHDAPAATHD